MAMSVNARKLQDAGFKVCKKCGETKPLTRFSTLTYRHNGMTRKMYSSPCLDCKNTLKRNSRKPHEKTVHRNGLMQAGMKHCAACDAVKPLSEFYTRPSGKVVSPCKACIINKSTERAKENPMLGSIWAKRNRKRIKDIVFAAYGGYKCACCGETHEKFLSLDHINNDGAEFRRRVFGRRSAAGYRTYVYLYKNGFPEGLQVLCMNCNHGKRMNGGICPHQETCNDHPHVGVGSSDSKHAALVH